MLNLLIYLLYMLTSVALSHPTPPTAAILTPFNNADDLTDQKIGNLFNSKALNFVAPFPDSGRQRAVLEQESLVSKFDTGYSVLQDKVAKLTNPKPIIDTIQEHQKYGNDGGKIRAGSVAAVGAFEALSNLLNAAVGIPSVVTKHLARQIGGAAGPLGAKHTL